jgi:maltose alpha-D-glucosyltransferase / alpha-amylase
MLTLPAYGFFWFAMSDEEDLPSWHEPLPEVLPEFITLTSRDGRVGTALSGREGPQFSDEVLPKWLPLQRWFAAKDRTIHGVKTVVLGEMGKGEHALTAIDVDLGDETQRYFLPLSVRWGDDNLRHGAPKLSYTLSKMRRGPTVGALIDGAHDERLAAALLDGMRAERRIEDGHGSVVFEASERLQSIEDLGEPHYLGVEQSNISVSFDNRVILKIYRRLRAGEQPDVEVARFLTETANFPHTPHFLGAISWRPAGGDGDDATTLAAAFPFVPNQGDAWSGVSNALRSDLAEHESWSSTAADGQSEAEEFSYPLNIGRLLGQRTAELHRAFATPTDDPAFALEPLRAEDLANWAAETASETEAVMARLQDARPSLAEGDAALADRVLDHRDALLQRARSVARMTPQGMLSRVHGDYHLGQVLLSQGDVSIIDFEGEPARTLAERRAKSSPLQDVAGMLRSFDYAALMAVRLHPQGEGAIAESALRRLEDWRQSVARAYLAAYEEHAAGTPNLPEDADARRQLLDLFLLRKAIYEISYELGNRPAWVGIPLRGVLEQIMGDEA